MHKYRLISIKGEGTFSEVLKAQSIKNGKCVAIKCMKANFESIQKVNNLREIQALRRLSPHPHIIKLHEVLYDHPSGRLALVFELMDCNIYEMIKGRRQYLPEELIKAYMYQLLKSINHMHRNGIFHRDIKPENILIVDKTLKLADFGSCRGIYSKQPYTEYISTRWYRAPECLLTDGYYGYKMDIWGIGCVIFELLALFPLFPGKNEADQIERIFKILGTPPAHVLAKFQKYNSHRRFHFKEYRGTGIAPLLKHCSKEVVDLVERMVDPDPTSRITAGEALKHPWFAFFRAEEKRRREAKRLAKREKEKEASGEAVEGEGEGGEGDGGGGGGGGGGTGRGEKIASVKATKSPRIATSSKPTPLVPPALSPKGGEEEKRGMKSSARPAVTSTKLESPSSTSASKYHPHHHHPYHASSVTPTGASLASSVPGSTVSSSTSSSKGGASKPRRRHHYVTKSSATPTKVAPGGISGVTPTSSTTGGGTGAVMSSSTSSSPTSYSSPWMRRAPKGAEARAMARLSVAEQGGGGSGSGSVVSAASGSVLRSKRSHGSAMQPLSGYKSGGASLYAASSHYSAMPVSDSTPFMSPLRAGPGSKAPPSYVSPTSSVGSSSRRKGHRGVRRVRGEITIGGGSSSTRRKKRSSRRSSRHGQLQPLHGRSPSGGVSGSGISAVGTYAPSAAVGPTMSYPGVPTHGRVRRGSRSSVGGAGGVVSGSSGGSYHRVGGSRRTGGGHHGALRGAYASYSGHQNPSYSTHHTRAVGGAGMASVYTSSTGVHHSSSSTKPLGSGAHRRIRHLV